MVVVDRDFFVQRICLRLTDPSLFAAPDKAAAKLSMNLPISSRPDFTAGIHRSSLVHGNRFIIQT